MTYTRDVVEHLLPLVWDPDRVWGVEQKNAPPPDMPTGYVNPAHGNNLAAYLIDIQSAWAGAPLTLKERQAVFMRFALDLTHQAIGDRAGVSRKVITVRLFTAVGKLTCYLNGTDFKETEEDIERDQLGPFGTDGLRTDLLAHPA